jgi:hypothetical protein
MSIKRSREKKVYSGGINIIYRQPIFKILIVVRENFYNSAEIYYFTN